MFIYWSEQKSKKNKPPKQRIWYETNYYAYLRESTRDEKGKVHHPQNFYLGSIKKIGRAFSKNRKAFFYLDVEVRLKEKNFSDEEIKKTFKMLRKKVPFSDVKFLEEVRFRSESMAKKH